MIPGSNGVPVTLAKSSKPWMDPFHRHASAPIVATAPTSVSRLRTTPDVNVPARLPKRRVLERCWSQSSLVKTVRRYGRDASE